jgi:hypothetical protein
VTRFENDDAIATGDVNRAIQIDAFERIVETNFDHGSCINCYRRFTVWWHDSDIRNSDVLIAWRAGRIRPFPSVGTGRNTQQIAVYRACYRT